MDTQHKLEIYKIIVGLIMAGIGALWTYYQYIEDGRKNSARAIVEISEAIVDLQMLCQKNDNELISHVDKPSGGRERRCFESYMVARKRIISGSTVISRPWRTSKKDWEKAWKGLKSKIENAAVEFYSEKEIGEKWSAILKLKRVWVIDPTPEYTK